MPTKLLTPGNKQPVVGDDLQIDFTITGVPAGSSFTKAWMTFKRNRSDADASAIIAPTITSGLTVTSTTLTYSITITKAQSILFTPGIKYYWDAQVMRSTGAISTPIADGEVIFSSQTTIASS